MICQKCKKVEATEHLTDIVKGKVKEFHLCKPCAKASGFLESKSLKEVIQSLIDKKKS